MLPITPYRLICVYRAKDRENGLYGDTKERRVNRSTGEDEVVKIFESCDVVYALVVKPLS